MTSRSRNGSRLISPVGVVLLSLAVLLGSGCLLFDPDDTDPDPDAGEGDDGSTGSDSAKQGCDAIETYTVTRSGEFEGYSPGNPCCLDSIDFGTWLPCADSYQDVLGVDVTVTYNIGPRGEGFAEISGAYAGRSLIQTGEVSNGLSPADAVTVTASAWGESNHLWFKVHGDKPATYKVTIRVDYHMRQ